MAMTRYTPRVPNQKISISHWFPHTEAAKSGFRRVKDWGVSDPPTAVNSKLSSSGVSVRLAERRRTVAPAPGGLLLEGMVGSGRSWVWDSSQCFLFYLFR